MLKKLKALFRKTNTTTNTASATNTVTTASVEAPTQPEAKVYYVKRTDNGHYANVGIDGVTTWVAAKEWGTRFDSLEACVPTRMYTPFRTLIES